MRFVDWDGVLGCDDDSENRSAAGERDRNKIRLDGEVCNSMPELKRFR